MIHPPKTGLSLWLIDLGVVVVLAISTWTAIQDAVEKPTGEWAMFGLLLVFAVVVFATPVWMISRMLGPVIAFTSDPATRQHLALTSTSPSEVMKRYFRRPFIAAVIPLFSILVMVTTKLALDLSNKYSGHEISRHLLNAAAMLAGGLVPAMIALYGLLHILRVRFRKSGAPAIVYAIGYAFAAIVLPLLGIGIGKELFDSVRSGNIALILVTAAGVVLLIREWKLTVRDFRLF